MIGNGKVRVFRMARCWCGHAGPFRLEVVTGHGILRAGPVCGFHRSLGTWPVEYIDGLYESLVEDLRLSLGADPPVLRGSLS